MTIGSQFKTLEEIKINLGNYGGIVFDYLAVLNSIKNSTFSLPKIGSVTDTTVNTITEYKWYPDEFKGSNKMLREIILDADKVTMCGVGFWKRKYNVDVMPYFNLAKLATKESRLRLLHFKLLHNIYPTNILLKKMKIKENDKCEICGEVDFIEHMFFKCRKLTGFWSKISLLIETMTNLKVILSETSVLFGITKATIATSQEKTNIINHIILIGKVCISKAKYGKIKNINVILDRELELRKNYFK